jgi:hypothetical protein
VTLRACLFFAGASNLIAMARRGPRTTGGKSASSRNAIKHGLGATAPVVRQVESIEDWNWHLEQVIADRQPEGYLETQLAIRIAETLWRQRRIPQYEAGKISAALESMPDEVRVAARYGEKVMGRPAEESYTLENMEIQTSIRMLPDSDTRNSIIRYDSHFHRLLMQTLHELEAMQARRKGEQTPLARLDISGPPGS